LGPIYPAMEEKQSHIETALAKFGGTVPAPRDFALHCGFSNEEADMLAEFWHPAFTDSWIYLSKELISKYMTKEKSKSKFAHFYSKALLSGEYEKERDYKEVEWNDEIIKEYRKIRFQNSETGEDDDGPVNGKKYYVVTGDTYKDLLMRAKTVKGKQARAYYRKVEQLAKWMHSYISLVGELLSTRQREEIAKQANVLAVRELELKAANEALARREQHNETLTKLVQNTKFRNKKQCIYIATSLKAARGGEYKVGGSKSKDRLVSRMKTYNTGKTSDDKMFYAHVVVVDNFKRVEERITDILGTFKDGRTEMYTVRYGALVEVVDRICRNHNNDVEWFNLYLGELLKGNTSREESTPAPFDLSQIPDSAPDLEPKAMPKRATTPLLLLDERTTQQLFDEGELKTFGDAENLDMENLSDGQRRVIGIALLKDLLGNPDFNFEQEKMNAKKIPWTKTMTDKITKICRKNKTFGKPADWKELLKSITAGTGITVTFRGNTKPKKPKDQDVPA
jgi:phage anti-repressor protein